MGKVLVNVGCGPRGGGRVPAMFDDWRHVRVDVEPDVEPDIVANLTDLSAITTGSAGAVWAAHCVEHLYRHEVGVALAEFRRVLADDGFVCILVPDLQTVANAITSDRLLDVLYHSPAGGITAHDIVFGFGEAIARGHVHMQHRCGFTPSALMAQLRDAGFGAFAIRRLSASLELVAVAQRTPWTDNTHHETLFRQLGL